MILGLQKGDGSICDCFCPPAIIDAQQLSQNSLFKEQDLLFPAWAVTKTSHVRDF